MILFPKKCHRGFLMFFFHQKYQRMNRMIKIFIVRITIWGLQFPYEQSAIVLDGSRRWGRMASTIFENCLTICHRIVVLLHPLLGLPIARHRFSDLKKELIAHLRSHHWSRWLGYRWIHRRACSMTSSPMICGTNHSVRTSIRNAQWFIFTIPYG